MLSRRHVSLISITAFALLLLTQFQNCAPAASTSTAGRSDNGADARLIEDFNKVEIQFAAPEVQLHDEALQADVSGLCNRSHNGAKLKWTIWAGAGQALLHGEASCAGGQFNLHMSNLDQVVCGVGHQLVVESDWGGSAFTHLMRRCQPLASEVQPSAPGTPAGTTCALEYVLGEESAPSAGGLCSQVCYRQGQVMSELTVDREQCSALAARLAGP